MENNMKDRGFELSDIKKEQPFKVPEGYFETFSGRLTERIKEERYSKVKLQRMRYIRPVVGIAVSIAAILLLMFLPLQNIVDRHLPADGSAATEEGVYNDFESVFSYITNVGENSFIFTINELMNTDENGKLEIDELEDYIAYNFSDYDIVTGFE